MIFLKNYNKLNFKSMGVLFFLLFFVSLISLIVGLIKPTTFSRFIKGEITRKRIWLIFGISTFVFFILTGTLADKTATKEEENTINQNATTNNEISQPIVANDQKGEQQPVVENNEIQKEDKNENSAPVIDSPVPVPALEPAPTPAPSQTTQVDNQNVSPVSSETVSQKNAVRQAKAYLGYSAFSRDGLVAQLEYEKFSHADAVYGADNSGANWNEQAAKSAKNYMEYSAFSRGSLIEQLKHEKFTQAQAEYGANAVGL